jgi:lysophospholipase L1-like esterase
MLGTNDAKSFNWNKERFEKQYKEFVSVYVNLENRPEVILMSPPHCFPVSEGGPIAFEIKENNIESIAEFLRDFADKKGYKLIDLYDHTKEHPEWFMDGVHPNEKGNMAIAEKIADQLKST